MGIVLHSVSGTSTPLSQQLSVADGWLCLKGWTDYHEGREDLRRMVGPTKIEQGQPFTCDYNNGMHVIYDEHGSPWIKPGRLITDEDRHLSCSCRRGAHVPFSNDGGTFNLKHWPRN